MYIRIPSLVFPFILMAAGHHGQVLASATSLLDTVEGPDSSVIHDAADVLGHRPTNSLRRLMPIQESEGMGRTFVHPCQPSRKSRSMGGVKISG